MDYGQCMDRKPDLGNLEKAEREAFARMQRLKQHYSESLEAQHAAVAAEDEWLSLRQLLEDTNQRNVDGL